MKLSGTVKGFLTALVGIVFWSTTGIFMDYLMSHYKMPALQLAFWRNLLVCVALIPVLALINWSFLQIKREQIGFYLFYGGILAIFNAAWSISVAENGAAVATVLAYSSAGFTAILAFLFFREKLGLVKITAVILSLGGCILVSNAYSPEIWKLNPLGIVSGIFTGILFAGYTLIGREASKLQYNVWTSMAYSFAFGSVCLLLLNFLSFLPGATGSMQSLMPNIPIFGWRLLIFLSFVPTIFGFGLYNASMSYLPASVANLLATSEPAMTAIEASIFLRENMTGIQITGSIIILTAVLVMQFDNE